MGRIVAYSRVRCGASDVELIAQILAAFGLRTFGCAVFRILDILNTAVFLGAIVSILSGLITIVKGIKILGTGKRGLITSFLQLIVPKRWLKSLARFLFIAGSIEAVLGAVLIFVTSLANNVALFLLMKGICNTEVAEFNIDVEELDLGGLENDIGLIDNLMRDELENIPE